MPAFLAPIVLWLIAKAVAYRVIVGTLVASFLAFIVQQYSSLDTIIFSYINAANPNLAAILGLSGALDYIEIVMFSIPFAVFVIATKFVVKLSAPS